MRIGVNALYLIPGGVGGTEVYLRNLLQAMAKKPRGHQFVIFTNRETGSGLTPSSPSFQTAETGVSAKSRPRRIIYEQTMLLRDARVAKVDVLFNPGFTTPLATRIPSVTVIHDLQHHRHPEYFKKDDLLAWRFFVWSTTLKSRRILTVSAASREDIHEVYGVPLDHIHTAEPGVEPEFFQLTRKAEEPMVLCVSTLHPHKNIERLVDAFAAFRAKRPEYRLTLAGMPGFHGETVARRIAQHGLEQHVTRTGWIPRIEIVSLYQRARIAVFPSLFEGFGMPVAEAMAAGVPLITSDRRPMKDIAGDAAILFPATDTEALTAAMETFAANPTLRAMYAGRARKRAAVFTWERAAVITLDALEAAART
ncbi:MAG: glycosyltransferase family 4 protein [Acidobacteria bacterium]|nr:glycosyltransferase family 4 protein [Acidobacteriota bacterium]